MKLPRFLKKTTEYIKKLPSKKHHLDFIVAILTIPVLLTVIITNLYNISQNKNSQKAEISVSPAVSETVNKLNNSDLNPSAAKGETNSASPTTAAISTQPTNTPIQCNQTPQPYTIAYPKEGENVSGISPVCIVLQPIGAGYCSTKNSYRVNGGSWSGYQDSDQSICLNNLSDGSVVFQLKTKSDKSGIEQQYTVKFTYQEEPSSPSATPTF